MFIIGVVESVFPERTSFHIYSYVFPSFPCLNSTNCTLTPFIPVSLSFSPSPTLAFCSSTFLVSSNTVPSTVLKLSLFRIILIFGALSVSFSKFSYLIAPSFGTSVGFRLPGVELQSAIPAISPVLYSCCVWELSVFGAFAFCP